MNRRRFSGALLGAGSLLLTGTVLSPTGAFARTARVLPGRTSSDDTDDLFDHVASSLRRTYDCESPMAFVIAIGVEMDQKRYASDMYDNLLTTGITTFEDMGLVFDDDREYGGDLTDMGHVYTGVIDLGEDAPPVYVAVLYTQQDERAYAIAAGNLDDPMSLLDEYYETLFDEDRDETDLLLTEEEMPRGFTVSEDIEDFVTDEMENDTPADDEDRDRGSRKRSGAQRHISSRVARGMVAAGQTRGGLR